jgi:hypothetical protein
VALPADPSTTPGPAAPGARRVRPTAAGTVVAGRYGPAHGQSYVHPDAPPQWEQREPGERRGKAAASRPTSRKAPQRGAARGRSSAGKPRGGGPLLRAVGRLLGALLRGVIDC